MARYDRLMRRLLDRHGLNFSDRVVIRSEDVKTVYLALFPNRLAVRKLMARQCLTLVHACLHSFRRRRITTATQWWSNIQAGVGFCRTMEPSLVREFTLSLVKARRENSGELEARAAQASDHAVTNGLEPRTALEIALDFLDDRFFIEGLCGEEDEVEAAARDADAALLDELQQEVDKAMRGDLPDGDDTSCSYDHFRPLSSKARSRQVACYHRSLSDTDFRTSLFETPTRSSPSAKPRRMTCPELGSVLRKKRERADDHYLDIWVQSNPSKRAKLSDYS